jgi:catechol 2,3-dioxygenase-like lactoylglutathione lyase family enzyme
MGQEEAVGMQVPGRGAEMAGDTSGRSVGPYLIKKLHHHAFRSRDIEKTRHFYEDVLGLPLIGTFVETENVVDPESPNYIHTFFEMGDGSCLAFFQFPKDLRDGTGVEPLDAFSHHFAMEVDGKDAVDRARAKFDELGLEYTILDHGYCYSIYTRDPNGMTVELTSNVEVTAEVMAERKATAHEDLRNWLAGVYENNNRWRGGKVVSGQKESVMSQGASIR